MIGWQQVGRVRRELGVQHPATSANCLAAPGPGKSALAHPRLFQYRFKAVAASRATLR